MNISDISETGTVEPCYMLVILDESKNETETADNGYTSDNPLIVQQGSYELWIKMTVDDQPYRYPHLHVRAINSARVSRRQIPFFNTDESTRIAVVFRSESGPEKSEKIETTPLKDDQIPLGKHRLGLGDLHILLIGYIPIDFVEFSAKGDVADFLTDFIPVNLNFWLRVVD
jgi:hypothetical protein